MTLQQQLDKMLEMVSNGGIIVITTALKQIQIDSQTVESFKKSGIDILKIDGNHLVMYSGGKYVSTRGNQVQVLMPNS